VWYLSFWVLCHIYIYIIKKNRIKKLKKKTQKRKRNDKDGNNPILLGVVQPPQFGRLEVAEPPLGQAPESTIPNG
jgi:hypothetical protein